MFGQTGAGQPNPFAALFGGMNPAAANPSGPHPSTNTSTNTTASPQNPENTSQNQTQNQQQQPPYNPFAGLFGAQAQGQQQNPMASMTQQMMQNPEMMRMAMQMMGMGGNSGSDPAQAGGQGASNPFGSPPPPPQDTRPPEEQYAEQLRQLNEMGFYEFDRNIRALRMSGGSVQGAVEALLNGV